MRKIYIDKNEDGEWEFKGLFNMLSTEYNIKINKSQKITLTSSLGYLTFTFAQYRNPSTGTIVHKMEIHQMPLTDKTLSTQQLERVNFTTMIHNINKYFIDLNIAPEEYI